MNIFKWSESNIQKMDWIDVGALKVTVAAIILLIAKLWSPLLALEWYWYLIIALIALTRLFYTIFKK